MKQVNDMERVSQKQIQLLIQTAELRRLYQGATVPVAQMISPCVLVTSAVRGEGKTSLTALLAAATAKFSGKRVLAFDLNWHQPALHSCFGIERSFSVEQFRTDLCLDSQVRPSGIKGLEVLPAPPPRNEVDGLSYDLLDLGLAVLEQARSLYEWVFVDSAAIYPTNRYMIDPVVISGAASGVLLVVLAGVTSRQQVKKTLVTLETAGANMIGAIVNQWRNPLSQI